MIRRILVPLDGSSYTDSALEVAFRLAKRGDAEVTGLVVLDTPGIERSIGPIPIGGMHYADLLGATRAKVADDHIRDLLGEFEAACQSAGVRYSKAKYQGSPSKWIFREASFYDIVVLGMRTHFDFESQTGRHLSELLELTVTPIVAVPEKTPIFSGESKSRVVIVMGETQKSIRAVQRFVAIANPDIVEPVLFMAHSDKDYVEYYLERTANYLSAHGFTPGEIIGTVGQVIPAIQEHFKESADLFVVGSSTLRRFRALKVGNVTRALIDDGATPLFIG
ncbi:MAG: universal stress protein [Rhodothermales bacterium]|nr:universal stress protein [Rhodothermales bacterium]